MIAGTNESSAANPHCDLPLWYWFVLWAEVETGGQPGHWFVRHQLETVGQACARPGGCQATPEGYGPLVFDESLLRRARLVKHRRRCGPEHDEGCASLRGYTDCDCDRGGP